MMNKQKAKQELSQLQSDFKDYTDDFKKRTEELERIINGSGFDWDFKTRQYQVYGSGDITGLETHTFMDCANETNNKKYALQLSRVNAINALLMKLAEHFNPDGWEPDWDNVNEFKCHLAFNNENKKAVSDGLYLYIRPAICFHEHVIEDVIKELENNREKWVHLVGWAE